MQSGHFGHLLESFVVRQMIALGACLDHALLSYHDRDKDQVEVDLVMETSGKVWGIEVKAAANLQSSGGKGLRRLAGSSKERFRGGIVFYAGAAILPHQPPTQSPRRLHLQTLGTLNHAKFHFRRRHRTQFTHK